MKRLRDFVKNYNNEYKYPTDILRSFDSFCEINKTNDDCASDWYIKEVLDNRHSNFFIGHTNEIVSPFDYINEMQKSVTAKQLIKLLNRDFASKYGEIFSSRRNSDKRETHSLIIPYDIFVKEWKKFHERLNAYLWYETRHLNRTGINNKPEPPKVESVDGKDYITIVVDPIQAKECNDYVYKDCKGIIYHVPDQSKIDEIIQSGLRMKGSKNTYKFIVDRVYFICGENEDEIKRRLKRIFDDKSIYNDNPTIFRIDLNKNNYNISFYEDPAYKNRDAIYTYAYFPSKMIDKISFNEI